MAVRRATEADAEAIAYVHVRTWQSAYRHLFPPQELDALPIAPRVAAWRRQLAGSAGAHGVLVDDARSGFASVGPSRDEDGVGELYAIYVRPERWGTGVGRELIAAAEEELRALGFAEATLWVLDDNPRARAFYAACGWRPDGGAKRGVHLGVAVDELRYRKSL